MPFNKLPLAERLQPIVFGFGVTWLRGNINMAAEGLESAEFEWSFDNTSHSVAVHSVTNALGSVNNQR